MTKRNQDTASRLHSAAIRLLRWLRREDRDSSIPPAQLSALSVIVFKGPIPALELAAEEQVSGPTMTRTVQGLVDAGLVTRTSPAADRRRVMLAATERGTALLGHAAAQRVAVLRRAIERLDPEQQAVLQQAAEILLRLSESGMPATQEEK